MLLGVNHFDIAISIHCVVIFRGLIVIVAGLIIFLGGLIFVAISLILLVLDSTGNLSTVTAYLRVPFSFAQNWVSGRANALVLHSRDFSSSPSCRYASANRT